MVASERASGFKKGIDASECRRRRTETSIKLRKDKKEEGLAKRRAMAMPGAAAVSCTPPIADPSQPAPTAPNTKKKYTSDDIPSLMAALSKPGVDDATLLESVQGFRKMLSVEVQPPVSQVLQCGALPMFVQMLNLFDKPKVQFEAAWALTNIASTDRTQSVVDAGALPLFVMLLNSPSPEVREQSAWCLGNIAGDSTTLRDSVLAAGAMDPLLKNIAEPSSPSMYSNCVWSLSNLCRGKPQPELGSVMGAIPVLASVLKGDNADAKVDALWALSYLSDGDDERITAIMSSGVTEFLVQLIATEGTNMMTPALRILGNFVSGNDMHTQAVIDAGFFTHADMLLNHPKKNVRKETCWVLSNIAAGTPDQISQLLKNREELNSLINLAEHSEWDVRKEAVWTISNIATGGTDQHVHALVELEGIDALCSVLTVSDPKIIEVALDAIEHILKIGQKSGKAYDTFVDECDGLEAIENLQQHENEAIYEKSISLIEQYFGCDDEVEDENLAPAVNGNTFSFGVPQKSLGGAFDAVAPEGDFQQPMAQFNFAS